MKQNHVTFWNGKKWICLLLISFPILQLNRKDLEDSRDTTRRSLDPARLEPGITCNYFKGGIVFNRIKECQLVKYSSYLYSWWASCLWNLHTCKNKGPLSDNWEGWLGPDTDIGFHKAALPFSLQILTFPRCSNVYHKEDSYSEVNLILLLRTSMSLLGKKNSSYHLF